MNINCLCLYLLCFNCSKVEYMWLHAGDDSNYNYLNKSLALEGGDNRDASMIIPSILWSDGLTSGRFDDCHSKSCPFNNPINLTTFWFCLELSRLYFVITLTGLSLTYCAPCYQRSCNVSAWSREQQYICSDNHVTIYYIILQYIYSNNHVILPGDLAVSIDWIVISDELRLSRYYVG